ncbi:MAG: hypothetical protein COV10_04765 [Candidatus Vogelbacteria bacterium CG10_big_fil_rev_8_21_14_0_10_51_16]|uniref:Type II toxin-antitoxin system antitoxin, RelB/DinJ family n=1 Tax=Candidatus Vogelbacteria bacterium CG10_big_fil_rev_8_21_14_0_10_51_16 TaxID=1975045 RepID=A0A2H0RCZ7_9BACT|nr:MAG: hypothetical protein COV10_04765 [Candidatus Vogelbacteria bacterium CG10_big_fil_rev_8_21_14_0_10_51_16]
MKTTAISVKIDPKVKREASKAVEELGMSLSTYINASLKQLVRTREAHFTSGRRATPYLKRLVAQAEEEYKKGDYSGPFDSIEEMDKHLDSL